MARHIEPSETEFWRRGSLDDWITLCHGNCFKGKKVSRFICEQNWSHYDGSSLPWLLKDNNRPKYLDSVKHATNYIGGNHSFGYSKPQVMHMFSLMIRETMLLFFNLSTLYQKNQSTINTIQKIRSKHPLYIQNADQDAILHLMIFTISKKGTISKRKLLSTYCISELL